MAGVAEVTPANTVLFKDLCTLFENLYKRKRQRQEQNKILMKFVNDFRLKVGQTTGKKNTTFYPILRLMLPSCERERSPYNMKEAKLGALLAKVLGLRKESDAGRKLTNFRAVDTGRGDSDFATIAFFVLKTRVGQDASSLSVGVINEVLDTIAGAETGQKGPILDEAFSYLMKKLPGVEFKWILRIILKDLKLGMSVHRILAGFHPDAPEHYDICNNIQKVCEEFEDGDTRPLELGVKIGYAISPMLSERLDITDINQLPTDKTYQIEDKFDGERFQMHMDNGVFEYFSRKGFAYSDHYGKTYDSGLLTPYLKDCINSNVKSVILDGEMMGWHKEDQYLGSKGYAYDIKKLSDNSKFRPCYCVYDVLYYNGRALVGPQDKGGVTLRERLQILDTIFTEVTGVIQLSKRKIVKDNSDILEALNKAIDDLDEGIVVKDVDSYYIPNKRNAGWHKIKPEYTEGAITDLDLVIVGADEAENKKQGRAKSFYVACLDNTPGSPDRWVCVGCVATGFSCDQREQVCSYLQSNWQLYRKKPPPQSIHFNKVKPDLWILPEHSIALQIKATELVRTSQFGADYTLRFPRVMRIRDDKPVGDVMTMEQFQQLITNRSPVEKLCTKRINMSDIEYGKKTRKTRASKEVKVAEPYRAVATGDVEVKSQALQGRKICVLSEDEDCKKIDLIKIIESHGGKHVGNIGADTWCSVVGIRTQYARKSIASGDHDILPTAWLRSLPISDTPCTLAPLDMLSIKKETQLGLSYDYDKYGDSYTETTDKETLKRCFEKMDKETPIYLTKNEKLEIDAQLYDEDNTLSYLRPCVMYVRNPRLRSLARFHQATVSDPSPHLTHVVVPKDTALEDLESVIEIAGDAKIVGEEWLVACLESKKMVSESKFLLRQ